MAWPGVEHLQPFPARPVAMATIGTVSCVIDSGAGGSPTYGPGHYTLFDPSAGRWEIYNGLITGSRTALASCNGKFWTSRPASAPLQSIDPASGAVTNHATFTSSHLVGVGNTHLGTASGVYALATDTYAAYVGVGTTAGRLGALGSRLFAVVDANYVEVDPVTRGVVASWPHGATSITNLQVACTVGNRLYWHATSGTANVIAWLDPTTGTTGIIAPSPAPGMPTRNANSDLVELGGNLYYVTGTGSASEVVAVNPATGQWASDIPVVARTNRFTVGVNGGKLWSPHGEPES